MEGGRKGEIAKDRIRFTRQEPCMVEGGLLGTSGVCSKLWPHSPSAMHELSFLAGNYGQLLTFRAGCQSPEGDCSASMVKGDLGVSTVTDPCWDVGSLLLVRPWLCTPQLNRWNRTYDPLYPKQKPHGWAVTGILLKSQTPACAVLFTHAGSNKTNEIDAYKSDSRKEEMGSMYTYVLSTAGNTKTTRTIG